LAGFGNVMPDGRPYGEHIADHYGDIQPFTEAFDRIKDQSVKNYLMWRYSVHTTQLCYQYLVNHGEPAEDARGLLPTNITTRINYVTNLRSLLDHAGNRLCTQAQFEWRLVFAQIAKALREYGASAWYYRPGPDLAGVPSRESFSSDWQFEAIAELLKPVCYQVGKCPMKASFDRACSIRSRVDANAEINRPSEMWGEEHDVVDPLETVVGVGPKSVVRLPGGQPVFIGAIRPAEWLADPGAAR
jgi:hypothetical protein